MLRMSLVLTAAFAAGCCWTLMVAEESWSRNWFSTTTTIVLFAALVAFVLVVGPAVCGDVQ